MKTRKNLLILIILLGSLLVIMLVTNSQKSSNDTSSMDVQSVLGASDNNHLFKKATTSIPFKFPEDAGPHPEFKSEWWYYTGNLKNDSGDEFGYQFTIFRQAISADEPPTGSNWRTNQVYMAHLAVTDVKNKKFYSTSRMTRNAIGLSGAQINPYRVWIENWEITGDYQSPILKAKTASFEIDIQLNSVKSIVLNGDNGLSQKSEGIGNASYYYSQTRLKTTGKIHILGLEHAVSGESWLDREWSTSSLSKDEVGWDWFSIQLDDNQEIMLYQIRTTDGNASNLSSGTITQADGSYYFLSKEDFALTVLDTWKSPDTKIEYPSKWQITIPKYNINLDIIPKINNQEHLLQFVYWEGAVTVSGLRSKGNGYVELVGYRKK